MRICSTFGSSDAVKDGTQMKEYRLDVFDSIPGDYDENTVITLCGKDVSSVPSDFKGLVDVGESDIGIPFRKIKSIHNFESTPSCDQILNILSYGDQEITKGAFMVRSFEDLHSIFQASKRLDREHLILGMGETGMVTRIRQKLLGNSFTFGYYGKSTAPGQLSSEELESLGDSCQIVGITGNPLGHTLSPKMQNAALRNEGINGIYLKFPSPSLDKIEDTIREYDIRGMNVTIPYKEDVISHLDTLSDRSEKTGAVNTIINDNGKLTGDNTDVAGIEFSFSEAGVNLNDVKKTLILGSGGAARAAVYAMCESGSEVHILARNKETSSAIRRDFSITDRIDGIGSYDAIINCTPVGMSGDAPYPFDLAEITESQIILDMVYNRPTGLVNEAMSRSCTIAKGGDMLIGQGAESFRLWFGKSPDTDIMRRAIL